MAVPAVVQGRVVGRADVEQPYPQAYPAYPQAYPEAYPQAYPEAYPQPYPAYPQATCPQAAFPQAACPQVSPQPYPEQHGAASGDWEVVQHSCRDASLPPEIRLGFVKKVYGILGMMLLLTFGISLPFILAPDRTLSFFHQNVWLLYLVIFVVVAQLVFDMAMSCQLCCGGTGLLQGYVRMMKTVPWNYLYLTTFSACFGVMVGFLCSLYQAQSVLLVFALTAVLIIALTIYAVRTSADFTGCGPYIMVMILGLLMLILVYSFWPGNVIFSKVIAGVGATLFGFIIVYDTQQIFGSASASFGGGKRDVEYTLDMYAFAAWNLYLDFLNFFIYMLQMFGERR